MAGNKLANDPNPNKIGDKFHKLTIIGEAEPYGKKHKTRWLCRCECGNERIVQQSALRQGVSTSCGCVRKARFLESNTKHGKSRSPMYRRWANIKSRCLNPNNNHYHSYGGRGIKICERWLEFAKFYKDVGEPPFPGAEIDRIDVNGNYEPSNFQWATRKQQNNNRRDTRFFTISGETKSLKDWCEHYNIKYGTVVNRVYVCGWDIETALTHPIILGGTKAHPVSLKSADAPRRA